MAQFGSYFIKLVKNTDFERVRGDFFLDLRFQRWFVVIENDLKKRNYHRYFYYILNQPKGFTGKRSLEPIKS